MSMTSEIHDAALAYFMTWTAASLRTLARGAGWAYCSRLDKRGLAHKAAQKFACQATPQRGFCYRHPDTL